MAHDNSKSDEKVGRLIAAAGPGPTARPEARERVYAAVRASWQESLARSPQGAVPAEGANGRGMRRYRMFGMAATVAAAAVVLYWIEDGGPGEVALAEIARVDRIEGSVNLVRDATTSSLAAADTAGPIRSGDVLRTAGDGQLALRLDQNLLLRVNVDSEIAVVGSDEIDLVAGTVYVDSGEESTGPGLSIRTPLGSVTHLGTQYEVHLADSGLRLRVREGAVRFSGAAGATLGAAGEQLDIGADGASTRSTIAANDAAWSWATGLATLPEQAEYRVGEALRWVAREQGLTLEYAGPDTERRLNLAPIVGLGGLDPAETLDVLARTTDLVLTVENGRLRVAN
jgi:ferric-dicitrate binding protein FerR (iron transport regulator)